MWSWFLHDSVLTPPVTNMIWLTSCSHSKKQWFIKCQAMASSTPWIPFYSLYSSSESYIMPWFSLCLITNLLSKYIFMFYSNTNSVIASHSMASTIIIWVLSQATKSRHGTESQSSMRPIQCWASVNATRK